MNGVRAVFWPKGLNLVVWVVGNVVSNKQKCCQTSKKFKENWILKRISSAVFDGLTCFNDILDGPKYLIVFGAPSNINCAFWLYLK